MQPPGNPEHALPSLSYYTWQAGPQTLPDVPRNREMTTANAQPERVPTLETFHATGRMPILFVMKSTRHLVVFLAIAFPEPLLAQNWGWPSANYNVGTCHRGCCSACSRCQCGWDWGWRRGCQSCSPVVAVGSHHAPSCHSCGGRAMYQSAVASTHEPQEYVVSPEGSAPELQPPQELPLSPTTLGPAVDVPPTADAFLEQR